jgi:peptidyl-prolyl cis-trans isomerase B (cyclophilin B)
MSLRSLLPSFLLPVIFLSGCATSTRTAGSGPQVAVMLVKVKKEKTPQRIVIELREDAAPQTVENFRELVRRHYYDGMSFHRLFPHQLVQTGDPKSRQWIVETLLQKVGLGFGDANRCGTGGPGYTTPAEIRLKLDQGAVATARLLDPINPTRASNGSQFFICIEPMSQLNGQYTVFGRVIEGLDQLDAISGLPVNSNDFPAERVVIQSIRLE